MTEQLYNNKNLSRKERERIFRKVEILNSSISVFAKYGYENAKLDDIAEAAEFGKGTLYNYFSSKEEIYTDLIEYLFTNHFNDLQEIYNTSKNFYEFMKRYIRYLFRICLDQKDTFTILFTVGTINYPVDWLSKTEKLMMLNEKITTFQSDILYESIQRQEIKKVDINRMMMFYSTISLSYIYNLSGLKEVGKVDIEKETDFIIDLIFNGVLHK